MQNKYAKEIDQASQELNDELYQKVRNSINNGKPIPYEQYIKLRALQWLNSIATEKDIELANKVIYARVNNLPPPSITYP